MEMLKLKLYLSTEQRFSFFLKNIVRQLTDSLIANNCIGDKKNILVGP